MNCKAVLHGVSDGILSSMGVVLLSSLMSVLWPLSDPSGMLHALTSIAWLVIPPAVIGFAVAERSHTDPTRDAWIAIAVFLILGCALSWLLSRWIHPLSIADSDRWQAVLLPIPAVLICVLTARWRYRARHFIVPAQAARE